MDHDTLGWISSAPTEVGNYDFKCGECNFEVELVTVFRKGGILMVLSDSVTYQLEQYHEQLIKPHWRKRAYDTAGLMSHDFARSLLKQSNLPIRVINGEGDDEVRHTAEPEVSTVTLYVGDETMVDGQYLVISAK